jgi:hypothetical protein
MNKRSHWSRETCLWSISEQFLLGSSAIGRTESCILIRNDGICMHWTTGRCTYFSLVLQRWYFKYTVYSHIFVVVDFKALPCATEYVCATVFRGGRFCDKVCRHGSSSLSHAKQSVPMGESVPLSDHGVPPPGKLGWYRISPRRIHPGSLPPPPRGKTVPV